MIKECICIQDLYKSTYKGFAFKSGSVYRVVARMDDSWIWVIDEENHEFSFFKNYNGSTYYSFESYFLPSTSTKND